jgi:hypothetical protein
MHNAAVTFWMVLCERFLAQFLICSKNRSCNFTHSANVFEQLGAKIITRETLDSPQSS